MAGVSTRTRFASLQKVFAQGRSPLMDGIAQLSVLYEDLRIETFALTASDEAVKRLDCLDKRYRVHYFLRRSIATLFEFRGALIKTWKTDEFRTAHAAATNANAPLSLKSQKVLFDTIAESLRFFERHHPLMKALRNAVGGHFNDDAAALATRNLHPDATSKLEVIFHPSGRGGGPKLHYAGEIAATAFAKTLPGLKPRAEEISDTIQMIRDAYSHATQAMHALIVLFLWDRFA